MKIYLASSWRNADQPLFVDLLRNDGHEVYDFRHPPRGDHLGFSWAEVDPFWEGWHILDYVYALTHPVVQAGFASDFDGMRWADVCVLLLPCGRSAHLEAGYFVGAKKPLIVVLADSEFYPAVERTNPELMYLLADKIVRPEKLLDVLAPHRHAVKA